MSATSKAIIYDDNCPLCKAYTSAFVSAGLITKENRIPFSAIKSHELAAGCNQQIDWNKARHEIPVIDTVTGKMLYGVDALVSILQQKFPGVKKLVSIPLFKLFFLKLYKLVSYNRKIIVANTKTSPGTFDCSPDYNFTSRVLLIIITYAISVCMQYIVFNNILDAQTTQQQLLCSCAWIIIPLLSSISKSIRTTTDVLAHGGIIAIIVSFVMLMCVMMKNFFSLPLSAYIVFMIPVVYVVVKQVAVRRKFLQTESIR